MPMATDDSELLGEVCDWTGNIEPANSAMYYLHGQFIHIRILMTS